MRSFTILTAIAAMVGFVRATPASTAAQQVVYHVEDFKFYYTPAINESRVDFVAWITSPEPKQRVDFAYCEVLIRHNELVDIHYGTCVGKQVYFAFEAYDADGETGWKLLIDHLWVKNSNVNLGRVTKKIPESQFKMVGQGKKRSLEYVGQTDFKIIAPSTEPGLSQVPEGMEVVEIAGNTILRASS